MNIEEHKRISREMAEERTLTDFDQAMRRVSYTVKNLQTAETLAFKAVQLWADSDIRSRYPSLDDVAGAVVELHNYPKDVPICKQNLLIMVGERRKFSDRIKPRLK